MFSRRAYLSSICGLVGSASLVTAYRASESEERTQQSKGEMSLSSKTKIIGHRGANGLAPQNTRLGIQLAAKHSADGVELDVRQASDGTLVLFHNPVYNFTTENGTGLVSEVPYSRAKEIQIASGQNVLSLREGIHEAKNII